MPRRLSYLLKPVPINSVQISKISVDSFFGMVKLRLRESSNPVMAHKQESSSEMANGMKQRYLAAMDA